MENISLETAITHGHFNTGAKHACSVTPKNQPANPISDRFGETNLKSACVEHTETGFALK